MTYTYPMIAHCDDDGFGAEFLDLPGCLTEGNTETELLKNAKEALQGFLEVLLSEKDVFPQPTSLFRLTVPKNCASTNISCTIHNSKTALYKSFATNSAFQESVAL